MNSNFRLKYLYLLFFVIGIHYLSVCEAGWFGRSKSTKTTVQGKVSKDAKCIQVGGEYLSRYDACRCFSGEYVDPSSENCLKPNESGAIIQGLTVTEYIAIILNPQTPTCASNGKKDFLRIKDQQANTLNENDCKNLSYENLCKKSKEDCVKLCNQVINAPLCASNNYCVIRNEAIISERKSNLEVRKQTFQVIAESFEAIRNDPKVLSACCDVNEKCKDFLSGVELKIIMGLPDNDQTGYYIAKGIYLSEGMVFSKLTESSMTQLLLHEFGHACQDALSDSHQCPSFGGTHCEDYDEQLALFDRLQPNLANCVKNSLASEIVAAKNRNHSFCEASWVDEAFADAIYSRFRPTVSDWAWPCGASEDAVHATPDVFGQCLIDFGGVNEALCPADGRL